MAKTKYTEYEANSWYESGSSFEGALEEAGCKKYTMIDPFERGQESATDCARYHSDNVIFCIYSDDGHGVLADDTPTNRRAFEKVINKLDPKDF